MSPKLNLEMRHSKATKSNYIKQNKKYVHMYLTLYEWKISSTLIAGIYEPIRIKFFSRFIELGRYGRLIVPNLLFFNFIP